MIERSKEGFSLKSSFAFFFPSHFYRTSLQGARHSWYNFSSVYVHALCMACVSVHCASVRTFPCHKMYIYAWTSKVGTVVHLDKETCLLKHLFRYVKGQGHIEGQMIKWSYIELAHTITCTFMHGFLNNMARLFSLKCQLKHLLR